MFTDILDKIFQTLRYQTEDSTNFCGLQYISICDLRTCVMYGIKINGMYVVAVTIQQRFS